MKHSTKLLALGLTLAAVIGLCSYTNTQAQGVALSKNYTKVAVCDIVSVFKDYKRAKALTKQLTERSKKYEAEAKRRAEALENLQVELRGYKPGSESFKQASLRLQRGIIEREVWARMQQDAIRRDHLRLTEEVFNDIRKMVATIARENNINLVVQLETGKIEAKSSPELIAQIDRRKVLYASDDINLTAAVLGRLNSAYRPK